MVIRFSLGHGSSCYSCSGWFVDETLPLSNFTFYDIKLAVSTCYSTMECDPNVVYPQSRREPWESVATNIMNTPLALIVIISSPFVICMPFTSGKRNNTCRKIISMIVLSDLVSTLANLQLTLGRALNEQPSFRTPCVIATATVAVTQRCSLCW